MTPEELQTKLDELSKSNEALAAKNRELLSEVKTYKAKAKGADIDPEEHAKLQSEVEELRIQLDKSSKSAKTEAEKLQKALTEKDGALQSILIDGGLTEAMVKAGVRPELMPAVKALLRSRAAIKADGGQYQAVMGDKAIAEAVSEWAASDEGKHFVAAPANNGGGALGAGSGGGRAKRFSDMTTEERTTLNRTDPKAYEAAKAGG